MGIGFNTVGNFSKISTGFGDKNPGNAVNITIMGVGGAGGNIIKFLMDKRISGVNFIYANTDLQALSANPSSNIIQLGKKTTGGFGAGSDPNVGEKSAMEATEEIKASLNGTNMLILIAGLGGGTGTGASPVIAKIAKEMGILVLSFAVLPFDFEGDRKNVAENWLQNLLVSSDSLISLSNQKLLNLDDSNLRFDLSLEVVHDIVYQGVNSIVSLLNQNELINRDFSDIVQVMKDKGLSLISSGRASNNQNASRALLATEQALNNPLLSDVSIHGAKGMIVTICAKQESLKTIEVSEVMNRITKEMNSHNTKANILLGVSFSDDYSDDLMVSIIATGLVGRKNVNADNETFNKFDYLNSNQVVSGFGQSVSLNDESDAFFNDMAKNQDVVESNVAVDKSSLNDDSKFDDLNDDIKTDNDEINSKDDDIVEIKSDKKDFDFSGLNDFLSGDAFGQAKNNIDDNSKSKTEFDSFDSDFGFSDMNDNIDNSDFGLEDEYSMSENKKGFFQSFFGRNDKLKKDNKENIVKNYLSDNQKQNNDSKLDSNFSNVKSYSDLDFLNELKDINGFENSDANNKSDENKDEIKISFLNSSIGEDDEFFSDINFDSDFSDAEKEIIKNDVGNNTNNVDDNVTYISEMDNNKKEAPKYYTKQVDIFELIESITGTK